MTVKQARWPDLSGRIEGERHILPVRVYYEDTDFSGVVYHASYLRFCERGRSDFLRQLGIGHRALHEASEGAAFAVLHMEVDFLKPARIDDVLEVVTCCAGVKGATLFLAQTVRRDGEVIFKASVKAALVGADGKPKRFPQGVRAAFKPFVSDIG